MSVSDGLMVDQAIARHRVIRSERRIAPKRS
jgi:hypothetical protein